MQVNQDALYQRYRDLDTADLIQLQTGNELTSVASKALQKVLAERGVTSEKREAVIQDIEEQKTAAMRLPLASLTQRFLARLIDGAIALALLGTPFLLLGDTDTSFVVAYTLFALYQLFQDGLPNGQSIGKHFLKIAVVNKRTGKACSKVESLLRNIILMILGFIDLLFLASKKRQRLGDMAANTLVITLPTKSGKTKTD